MSLDDVHQRLVDRLNQGDRGDRGWVVITRVHVALSWLKSIAEYLEYRGNGDVIRPTRQDYDRLATIIETDKADPGVQLRRHHLLVMDKPLQLLHRMNGYRWDRIKLTDQGRELAYADDPAEVLEKSLSDMWFAVGPWSPLSRVEPYGDFCVRIYEVTKQVLGQCDGYIDRNEFDFFVSRIRTENEAVQAAADIADYRRLVPGEQDILHTEVRNRIPGAKAYSNWRDVGLHTFSLFSLGTGMVREGTRLLLTSDWVGRHAAPTVPQGVAKPQLRMPVPPELEDLLTPPTAPASNDGTDAESFVAKVLRSQGWEVTFYTNRRGYGFDLWARKGNRAMVVEVKSSLGILGAVSLTPTEHQAAQEHGESFVLALVENMASNSPQMWMIQNPVAYLRIEELKSVSYVITRAEWWRATHDNG